MVWKSFLDGVGNTAGYGFYIDIEVAFFRKLLDLANFMVDKVI